MVKKENPEEYEVQYINSHRINQKGKKKTLEYEIKWKGYKSSENTWEPVSAVENAQDLVDMYWDTKGGQSARKEVERILNGGAEQSSINKEEEDFDEGKLVRFLHNKNKNKKRRVPSPTATRTSKKTRTETPALTESKELLPRSRRSKRVVIEQADSETDDSDISESEIENGDFRGKSNNWKTDVEKILSVRPIGDDQKKLYATVRWRDGKIGMNLTSTIAEKNPQLLISYYEKRLAFERKE